MLCGGYIGTCNQMENDQRAEPELPQSAETIRLKKFKTAIDRLLITESPKDADFYTQRWIGPTSLDTTAVPEPKAEGYLGTFSYFPLPAFGDVYKVNLLGEEPEEYLITFEMAPIMSNGGGFYVLVFGADDANNKLISADLVCQAQNIDSVRFIQMFENNPRRDILVFFDQEQSFYSNKGLKQLRMIENSHAYVLELRTQEIEQSSYDTITSEYYSYELNRSLSFMDSDGDGHKEIHSTTIFDRLDPTEEFEDSVELRASEFFEKSETLQECHEVWKWDSITGRYEAHVVSINYYLPD